MDTVTHALLGAGISDCWFRRRLGPAATPFALLLAAAPDADIASFLVSVEYAWTHHRGITHALVPMAAASPILGYLGYRLSRRSGSWGLWTLLAALCLFSHTFLDLVTSWGVMPFLPFSNMRMAWDIAPIFDVFVFSTCMASFVANRLLRWERVDSFLNPIAYPIIHKHPRRQAAANRIAPVVLILFAVYMLIGWHQNRQMVRRGRTGLAAAGFQATEVRAIPYLLTYISGTLVARDAAGNIRTAFYSSLAPEAIRYHDHPAARGPAAAAARDSRWGRMFTWYAQGMVDAREENKPDGGAVVRLLDRRFNILSHPDLSRFTMEVEVDAAGTALDGKAGAMNPAVSDFKTELGLLWRLTRHGEPEYK